MVTIKNKQQKWVITEKEYYENEAKWNALGEVSFEDTKEVSDCFDDGALWVDPEIIPEYDLQTEVEIKPKKNAKKKTKQ